MSPVFAFMLFGFCHVALAEKRAVEPEYLEMLQAAGRDEELAELLGIDVKLVRPQEGRSEEELMFTTVSELGDILLTAEQEEQARQGLLFQRFPLSKWPNNRIPYVISRNDFNSADVMRIKTALDTLSRQTSKLRIVPRVAETDYVMVMSLQGCYSNVGRIGRQQVISLQRDGCLSTGTIQHEFIHASGFTHEHNRPDRDDSVTVLFNNIPPEWKSQYEKVSNDTFGNQDSYEAYSVMHYPYLAPGTNLPAFELKDKTLNPALLGQRNGATPTDIRKINILYP